MGFKNILAIEPNPLTIKALQSNIKINGYENIIKLAPYCVGKEEELTFYSCADLGSSGVIKNELDSSAREIRVQSKTLESILYEYQIRKIDTLKIDIEGYEDVALMPFLKKLTTIYGQESLLLNIQVKNYGEIIFCLICLIQVMREQ